MTEEQKNEIIRRSKVKIDDFFWEGPNREDAPEVFAKKFKRAAEIIMQLNKEGLGHLLRDEDDLITHCVFSSTLKKQQNKE